MIARAVPVNGRASDADELLAKRLSEPLVIDELPRFPC